MTSRKQAETTNEPKRQAQNIDEAIVMARVRVPYFQKVEAKDLKYKIVPIEQVLRELTPVMNELGITISPQPNPTLLHDEVYEASRGGKMRRVIVQVNYEFRHFPSNTSKVVGVMGESSDSGDKAIPKAFTAALKAALRQGFGYETGETDPDVHPNVAMVTGRSVDTENSLRAKRALEQARTQDRLDYIWRHITSQHEEGKVTDEQYASLGVTYDKRLSAITEDNPVGV